MAYFSDLSFYDYFRRDNLPETKNIGWLQRGHEFDKMVPTEDTLDLLWSFCMISVMQSRGIHQCDLCPIPQTVHAARKGVRLLLGTSEIRVFSKDGGDSLLRQQLLETESSGLLLHRSSSVPFSIYAAPTLIYHYVRTHHYKPPAEFLRAISEGPRPQDQGYFEQLEKLNLEWKRTSSPPAKPIQYRFGKTQGEVRRVEEPSPYHLDES